MIAHHHIHHHHHRIGPAPRVIQIIEAPAPVQPTGAVSVVAGDDGEGPYIEWLPKEANAQELAELETELLE